MSTLLPLGHVLALLLSAAPDQNPRIPQPVPDLGAPPAGASYATGVEDAFAVAIQTDATRPGVAVSFQEDPGGAWSQPVRRSADPAGTGLTPKVIVVDGVVFVIWIERVTAGGLVSQVVYFDVTEEPGSPWRGPRLVAGDPNPGGVSVLDFQVEASTAGGAPAVFALLKLGVPGGATQELVLQPLRAAGGALPPPLLVPDRPAQTAAIGELALRSEGGDVHVSWTDDRNGAGAGDVFARTLRGGSSTFDAEVRLTASSRPLNGGLSLAAAGGAVAVAWLQDDPSGGQELRATLSSNGVVYEPDVRVGAYQPSIHDVDAPALSFDAAGSAAVLVWADDRTGADLVYAARRPGGSPGWPTEVAVFQATASEPTILASSRADGPLLVTALSAGQRLGSLFHSPQSGWSSSFQLASAQLIFESSTGEGHDGSYNDFTLSWLAVESGQRHQFLGGIRAQSVDLTGDLRTGQTAQWRLERFPAAEAGNGFRVLVAGGMGFTRLPDSRSLGLRNDAFLRVSSQRPELRGTLDAQSAGLTAPLLVNLPVGTSLFFCAFSFVGTNYGSITDVTSATVLP